MNVTAPKNIPYDEPQIISVLKNYIWRALLQNIHFDQIFLSVNQNVDISLYITIDLHHFKCSIVSKQVCLSAQ